MPFWETAFASAFGAGFGASAAFWFNLKVEARKQRKAEIEAGNVALAILRSKLLDVRMYENAWAEGLAIEGAPNWFRFRPRLLPVDMQRIDVASLGFLLSRGNSAIVADVRDAEHTYYDLMNVLREYRECYDEQLIPAMHAANIPETLTPTLATYHAAKLPRPLILKIDDLNNKLQNRFENAPSFITRAAANLHKALREARPDTTFESPESKGRLAAITPAPSRGEGTTSVA
jgi:hypothetical protein